MLHFQPDEVLASLKRMDMKITPQRRLIVDLLKDNTCHPTAEDLFSRVKSQLPNTSFTTIYNTLELLKRMGYLRELKVEAERRHFDPNTKPHHHLFCDHCGTISDLFTEFPEVSGFGKKSPNGFKVSTAEVLFHGTCGDCQTA